MKKLFQGLFLFFVISCISCNGIGSKFKVLVFAKAMIYYHESIPDGIAAIKKLGKENGFAVDTTTDSEVFNESNLQKYAAIIFLNTTGNVLNFEQESAFERYIQAGGGFVGIHSATDTEYQWPWYGELVGAYFQSHPSIQSADFVVEDRTHISTKHFKDRKWHRTDELYNFRNINPDVNVLMTIDENSYEGGENGNSHPMSWFHEYDGGRAFYTAAGHTSASFSEPDFLKHLLGGIEYAVGENKILDYTKAKTQIPPQGDRFSKKTLVAGGFTEPTEMTILPNHDILIAQRRGELLHWDAKHEELNEVGKLDVYWKTNIPEVNAEEGFMGLQKDPNFEENHWIYCFYSPAGDEWVNRLSRFKFENGVFDPKTEQVIFDVPSDREICCHTGGSIAFGPDEILYLSTGDNSTPFDKPDTEFVNDGFAPLNDLPGDKQYDARRSSGNTNDLRGKILRIKVNVDGSYSIPKGNLFPEGTPKTRPEIFTMGHRNPYRISVDKKNGYVYWGDVGPDAGEDKMDSRGPMGYDEMNQAREAGNFGWPFFIADNKAYHSYDYSNGVSGPAFDPLKPTNNSRNNTGLVELPPAHPAFIYYPYAESEVFEDLGTGGRNAMAGPVYYLDEFSGEHTLPAYYDGKIIIYDWMRGWMKAVTLDDDGTVARYEPFSPDIKVNNLIDMEAGPDGRIYLLEYGSGWFSMNEDSGLGYIEYNSGNRPPVVEPLTVSAESGKAPLNIELSINAKDPEKDRLKYIWHLEDGVIKETVDNSLSYLFETEGVYDVYVEVSDEQGGLARSHPVKIVVGNTKPTVQIDILKGNESFFIPGIEMEYAISVMDPEDDQIDSSQIYVSVDYMEGWDDVSLSLGHHEAKIKTTGKEMVESMDCKSCHKVEGESAGPSFIDISYRYKDDNNALSYLMEKIKNGGGGVWGEIAMSAHPDLSSEDVEAMAIYIKSIKGNINKAPSLPVKGAIIPKASSQNNLMVITASYTDKGGNIAGPLTGIETIRFQSNTLSFGGLEDEDLEGFSAVNFDGSDLLVMPSDGGWFTLNGIDMSDIGSINILTGWQQVPKTGIEFQARKDSPEGEVLGSGKMATPVHGQLGGLIPIRLTNPATGVLDKLFITYSPTEDEKLSTIVALINITFGK